MNLKLRRSLARKVLSFVLFQNMYIKLSQGAVGVDDEMEQDGANIPLVIGPKHQYYASILTRTF